MSAARRRVPSQRDRDDLAVPASANATDEAKQRGLKFLGYWVGDVDQPLTLGSGTTGAATMSARGAALRQATYALGELHRRGAARMHLLIDRPRTQGRYHGRAARPLVGEQMRWPDERVVRDRP